MPTASASAASRTSSGATAPAGWGDFVRRGIRGFRAPYLSTSSGLSPALREMGITIAIDDFGTGFSSLSYLATLPADTLKIDRSFIMGMDTGPQGQALVSAIINMGHSLGLKVVAEGVETDEQCGRLALLGCDEIQGYLLSQPLPASVFEQRFLRAAAPSGAPVSVPMPQ